MRLDLFDFELPEERIALRPKTPRESARLLRVDEVGRLSDHWIGDLPNLLKSRDHLVFNNTSVISGQLKAVRHRSGAAGANVNLTLAKKHDQSIWQAFARPAAKLKAGDQLQFTRPDGKENSRAGLVGTVLEKGQDGLVLLRFSTDEQQFDELLPLYGDMPLPPYIASRRPVDVKDRQDYQTIFASETGAVAAPTAGLHFTENLVSQLDKKGIVRSLVTLHVGVGTFLPVKVEHTDDHKMHAEWGRIDEATADALNTHKKAGGMIVAAGTTALRLLESAVDDQGVLRPYMGETDIFIRPGYKFKIVDKLITNFHLPKSTLFMLVSAFCGTNTMKAAYQHAVDRRYRFYSYGDACLLERGEDL